MRSLFSSSFLFRIIKINPAGIGFLSFAPTIPKERRLLAVTMAATCTAGVGTVLVSSPSPSANCLPDVLCECRLDLVEVTLLGRPLGCKVWSTLYGWRAALRWA